MPHYMYQASYSPEAIKALVSNPQDRTGAAKAAILQRLLTGGCDPALPASWLLRHPRVRLWVDDAALGVAVAAR